MNKTKHNINKKRPCTTTLKMNLLSSLCSYLVFFSFVPSSLSLSLSLSLSVSLCLSLSLSLSVSVSVWCCGHVVVVCCGVSCCVVLCCVVVCVRCGVWCVVCDTLKNSVCPLNTSPCVRSKRPRVYWHHAQFQHVRVVPAKTGTF